MSKLNLRIHVAPVGFEIDRIVMSAKERRADKVYLMVHDNPAEEKAQDFVDRIQKLLKKEKIDVVIESHNRLDLFAIIKSIKHIIKKEDGNNIYVNLASGSKIQAIAGMMACMMFNEQKNVFPFYVEAEQYHGNNNDQISSGIKELIPLPSYEIQTPEQKHIDALKIIRDNKGEISKKNLAKKAEENHLIEVNAEKENQSQALFASLDKNITQPLMSHWKFIEEEKRGRTRWIKMTQEGNNAAKFLL